MICYFTEFALSLLTVNAVSLVMSDEATSTFPSDFQTTAAVSIEQQNDADTKWWTREFIIITTSVLVAILLIIVLLCIVLFKIKRQRQRSRHQHKSHAKSNMNGSTTVVSGSLHSIAVNNIQNRNFIPATQVYEHHMPTSPRQTLENINKATHPWDTGETDVVHCSMDIEDEDDHDLVDSQSPLGEFSAIVYREDKQIDAVSITTQVTNVPVIISTEVIRDQVDNEHRGFRHKAQDVSHEEAIPMSNQIAETKNNPLTDNSPDGVNNKAMDGEKPLEENKHIPLSTSQNTESDGINDDLIKQGKVLPFTASQSSLEQNAILTDRKDNKSDKPFALTTSQTSIGGDSIVMEFPEGCLKRVKTETGDKYIMVSRKYDDNESIPDDDIYAVMNKGMRKKITPEIRI